MVFHLESLALLKRRWFPPVLLAVAVVAFFAPVVFGNRVFFLKDAQLVVYPIRLALRDRLLSWDLPQWLPQLDLGLPFLADPANGVLYPLNVILLLPAPWSIGVFIVFHLVLGALGAFALLRALRLTRWSAVFGALGFALGGYMVSLTWIANYTMSLGWMPVVAWAALQTLKRRRLRDAAITGLLLGLQVLAGEPQGVILTGWLVLTLALSFPATLRQRLHGAALLGASLAIAACLACPLILPTMELLPRSRRAQGIDLVQASHWSLHPLRLLELAAPWLWGNPIRFDEFLGFFMNDEGYPMHRDPWIATPYFGSIGLVLCGVGIIAPPARHRWWVRGLSVLSLLTLLLALGRHTPIFAYYFAHVPGASLFRYPAKFFGLLGATLPFLAAAGLDAMGRRNRSTQVFLVVWAALLLPLVLVVPMSTHIAQALHALRPAVSSAAAHDTVFNSLTLGVLLLAVSAGFVLLAQRYRPRWLGPTAVVLLALQLAIVSFDAYETADAQVYAQSNLARRMVEDTPRSYLPRVFHTVPALQLPSIDAWPGSRRAHAINESLMMNTGIAHGIHYARAYTSADEGPKRQMWQEAAAWQRGLLDAFGVRYLVLPESIPVDPGLGLKRMDEPGKLGAAAYRNASALPFAFPVATALTVDSPREALRALSSPPFMRGRVVALEADAPVTETVVAREDAPGVCDRVAPLTDKIVLDCAVARPGWVVINESHHPNWTATVNAEPTTVLRANALVMAVAVEAGRSRIALTYAEPSLPFGFSVSGFGLLLCVMLLVPRRPAYGTRKPAHMSVDKLQGRQ